MTFRAAPIAYKRVDIYASELGDEIRRMLIALENNLGYKTEAGYTNNVEEYPTGLMPFVESHLQYLHKHPAVNPEHYMANLRVKLKIR